MKAQILSIMAVCGLAVPAQGASTATTRLVAIVPPMCSLDVLDQSIDTHRLTMTVRRHCNASHQITITGDSDAVTGAISLRFDGAPVAMIGGFGEVYEPEGYYDNVDRIVVETPSASPRDLRLFATTLGVSVDVT